MPFTPADLRTGGIPAPGSLPVTYDIALMHLTGLGDWRQAAEAEGYGQTHVNTKVAPPVIRAAERALQQHILPVRYLSMETKDSDPLLTASPYNYLRFPPNQLRMDASWGYFGFYAPAKPILAVQKMSIVANPKVPVFTLPNEWIVFERETGYITLQPATVAANAASLSTGAMILSLTTMGRDWLPQGIELIFDAGLPVGWESGFYYQDLHRYLGKKLALEMLNDLTQVFDAGRASVSGSAFGVNTTINYERFIQLRKELGLQTEKFEQDYRGENVGVGIGWI